MRANSRATVDWLVLVLFVAKELEHFHRSRGVNSEQGAATLGRKRVCGV